MIKAVAIGASWGGLEAVSRLIRPLGPECSVPLILVQHQRYSPEARLATLLDKRTAIPVVEVEDKMPLESGKFYVAPPGFHTLLEDDLTFTLCTSAPVNFCRPAIDMLFYSAADVLGESLMGIVLTGANHDGAAGLKYIRQRGGITIVQDPAEAEVDTMPLAAIEACKPTHVMTIDAMSEFLKDL